MDPDTGPGGPALGPGGPSPGPSHGRTLKAPDPYALIGGTS